MNCKIRNHHKIPLNIYQFFHKSAILFYNNSSGYRKRAVKPRCHQHSAIFFHIQFYIAAVHFHFRIFFYLECRRITVACHNMKCKRRIFRYCKSNQCGIISGHYIFSTRYEIPVFSFRKHLESTFRKSFFHFIHCLKCSRTFFYKFQ